jgi:hypothetical protein
LSQALNNDSASFRTTTVALDDLQHEHSNTRFLAEKKDRTLLTAIEDHKKNAHSVYSSHECIEAQEATCVRKVCGNLLVGSVNPRNASDL